MRDEIAHADRQGRYVHDHRVPLVSGPIDDTDATGARAWRELATAYLAGCRVLSPLRGKKHSLNAADYTPAELRRRDRWDIRRSDVVLCCFRPRPGYLTWGTPSECEYAAGLGKPVVFVCDRDSPLRDHPWARDQAVRFFTNLAEACRYILEMWRPE